MGQLTDDMTRLVGEINTGRRARAGLIRDINRSTHEMKAAVAHMMSRFHAAHGEMARAQRRNLHGFVSNLESMVAGMRSAFANDLAGARAAWFGGAATSVGRGHGKRGAKAFAPESA